MKFSKKGRRRPTGQACTLIERLALERCRHHLAHMQALLHLCDHRGASGRRARESVQRLIALADSELGESLGRRG